MTNQVALDPFGTFPEPEKNVRIIVKSSEGAEILQAAFSAPEDEPIYSLVVQARMMLPGAPAEVVVNDAEENAFFTIGDWNSQERILTVVLK